MNRRKWIFSHLLPDADDALRRLSDVIQVPLACRKRACRAARRCQGGHGPPCFFANRKHFADALMEEMQDHREYWNHRRAEWEAILRK